MANNRYIMFQQITDFSSDTFNTFDADARAHAVDQVSEDISEEHGFVYQQTAAKRLARNRLLGPRLGSGEIGVPMYTKGTPTLLYYALGAVTTTEQVAAASGNPALFKHVIKPANTIPMFRMGIGKDFNEHQYVGCGVKSLTIDYTVSDPALATFDLIVRKELQPGTIQTPTFPDYDVAERTFLGTEVTVSVNGTTVPYVRNLSIELANDIPEDKHVMGSRYLTYMRTQGLTITGSMELVFDDIARYNEALNEEENAFKFLFKQNAITSHTYRAIEIDIGKVSYDSTSLPTDANNEFILSVEFTAEVSSTVQDGMTITVYNNESNSELTK